MTAKHKTATEIRMRHEAAVKKLAGTFDPSLWADAVHQAMQDDLILQGRARNYTIMDDIENIELPTTIHSRLTMHKGKADPGDLVHHSSESLWYLWSPYDATESGICFGAKITLKIKI